MEKQCRDVAKKTGSGWKEFWPFLGDYVDLTSRDGLEKLETYLSTRYAELARFEEAERCREVEEDENDVFLEEMGELEFTTKPKPGTAGLEVMLEELDLISTHPQTYPAQTSKPESNASPKHGAMPSDPGSPLSALSLNLTSLNLETGPNPNTVHQEPAPFQHQRVRRPSQEAKVNSNYRLHIFVGFRGVN